MIEIIVAMLFGVMLGIITGLTPGIHVNLVSVLLISIAGKVAGIDVILVAIVIVATALTHTFVDIIPSVFLGAPSEDTIMSMLPTHALVLQGKGYEAVRLATIGSILAVVIGCLLAPIFLMVLEDFYALIKIYTAVILICLVAYGIITENDWNSRFWAVFVFTTSAILGYTVLNGNFKDPLFPLLSGLFGISGLFISINGSSTLPPQRPTEEIKVTGKDLQKSIPTAILSGWFVSMVPGIGSSQAAMIAQLFSGVASPIYYIIQVGAINTANFLFSLLTFYSLDKARNGAIVGVQTLIGELTKEYLIMFFLICLIVAGIATIVTFVLAKVMCNLLRSVNYELLCSITMLIIVILVGIISRLPGLLVLLVSTSVGLIAPLTGCKRIHAMGCLVVPVLAYYL